jgi:hypothetical protein
MISRLLVYVLVAILIGGCAASLPKTRDSNPVTGNRFEESTDSINGFPTGEPLSMMELPRTPEGGFVLSPGFYEAEFKTYCLQPGTPDPRQGDAYLQGPVTGYRKDIIESVLLNSKSYPDMNQRNVQLLLWSVVSGSDFNKLSPQVKNDAMKLLTPKQVFQLKGGVMGLIKTVSGSTGLLKGNGEMKRLFETGINSYESFERLAVLKEPAQIKRRGVKYDQWYKQRENYYVRYFPVSYQKVRIQVYVPASLLDSNHLSGGEYVVFDPTGQQAIPAFTNAQRLGIGAPVIAVVKAVIHVTKKSGTKKTDTKRVEEKAPSKE